MAERPNALALKASVPKQHRGFKSLHFRTVMSRITYLTGRLANTPARSFTFRLGGLEAAGFSPEIVGSVDASGLITTEPVAGTRAHGVSPDADAAARVELENDDKEIVEHAISVRTSCAEVAAVAVPGTTAVSEFMTVRPRGSLQHLASTVVGQFAEPQSAWDAIQDLFPSVTASGIPKARRSTRSIASRPRAVACTPGLW